MPFLKQNIFFSRYNKKIQEIFNIAYWQVSTDDFPVNDVHSETPSVLFSW